MNRHTVRRTLQHLQDEGLVRSEKGRGTFEADDITEYRLGVQTRFTQNLLGNNHAPGRRLLQLAQLPAPEDVAAPHGLAIAAPVLLAVILGAADGMPIMLGHNYYPLGRLPRLANVIRRYLEPEAERLSVTAVLRDCSVTEYRRRSTTITATMPSEQETSYPRMPSSEPVLVTESLDVDAADRRVICARTVFRAGRVQFTLAS